MNTCTWVRPKIAIKNQMALFRGNAQLIVEGIKQLDALAGTLGERDTVPGIFARAVLARLSLPRPSGYFKLGPPGTEPGLK